jgi:hypothetical protein
MGLLDSVKIKNNSCVGVLKALLSSYEPKVEEPIVGESKDWTDDEKKGFRWAIKSITTILE